ncbi:zinc ribbon domain-containing protein [Nocardioides sp. BP30]|uniref:zinc ribbon domain-containing protein n=1 Tax=Nocardioides sp. BP30 TaxID=3036374 RepID=UPI002469A976|nr:zinc ribbon domain-containing protein [Nocardioides sp. BP30]WGL51581.1 zinc ribbon domain-containing protein [Nocardioides sp. BP30]
MDQHFCTACGHRLGPGDNFCTGCGTPASTAAADESPERTAVRPSMLDQLMAQPADDTAVRRPLPPAGRPPRRRSRGRFWGWVAVAAVLVAAVSYGLGTLAAGRDGDDRRSTTGTGAGTGTATGAATDAPGTSASADPSSGASIDPQALAQARALRALLGRSAADKQKIAVAAGELETCRHLHQAVQTFEEAASSRDRLVTQVADLRVGLLPGGGAAVASFTDALRAAADADRAYVRWGEARHKGRHHTCRGGGSLRSAAVRSSSASHAPKQQTAQAWNVIAAQFGLARISWTSL